MRNFASKKLSSNNGFSLVGVMIAAIIGLILMMGMVKMMQSSFRTEFSLRQLNDFDTVKSNVKTVLSSEIRCASAFRDSSGAPLNFVVDNTVQFIPIQKIYLQNSPMLSQGDHLGSGLVVSEMKFKKTTAPVEDIIQQNGTAVQRRLVELMVTSVSKDGTIQRFDPPPQVSILTDPANNHRILGCDTGVTAGLDGEDGGDGTIPVGTPGTMKTQVMASWPVQGSNTSSEGDASDPRYVSQDVTDLIKSNCGMQTNDGSLRECTLFTEVTNRASGGRQWSYKWRLAYDPADALGNPESIMVADDANEGYKVPLDGNSANSCNWRGPGGAYTLCERHATSDGSWIHSGAGKIYLSVDRQLAANSSAAPVSNPQNFGFQFKLVKSHLVPESVTSVTLANQ